MVFEARHPGRSTKHELLAWTSNVIEKDSGEANMIYERTKLEGYNIPAEEEQECYVPPASV